MWSLRLGLLISLLGICIGDVLCEVNPCLGSPVQASCLPSTTNLHRGIWWQTGLSKLRLTLRGGGFLDSIRSSWRGWWSGKRQGANDTSQRDFRKSEPAFAGKRTVSPADIAADPPAKRGRVEPIIMGLHGGGKKKKKQNKQALADDIESEPQVEGPPLTSVQDQAATVQAGAGEASMAAVGEVHLTDAAAALSLDEKITAEELLRRTQGVTSSGNCMYTIEKVGLVCEIWGWLFPVYP
jgi:hypothetical protein